MTSGLDIGGREGRKEAKKSKVNTLLITKQKTKKQRKAKEGGIAK